MQLTMRNEATHMQNRNAGARNEATNSIFKSDKLTDVAYPNKLLQGVAQFHFESEPIMMKSLEWPTEQLKNH